MANVANVTLGANLDLSGIERQIRRVESRAINLNINATRPLGKLSSDVGEFEKSMAAANARVIAFGASAGIISGVTIALRSMITESINVEKALTQINSTMNLTTSQLAKFSDTIFNIAKNTGSSFNDVAKSAEQFSHSGLSMAETLKRTSDAMVLARISGDDASTSFKQLTALVNSFNKEGLTTTQVVDRIAAVSSRFGVQAKDLSEAMSGIGEAAQDAKVGFNELISLITRVQQTTSKGGAEIGVALKTIFSRIERKDTLDSLDKLGISVRTVGGETLPVIDILSRLANTYDRLGDSQKEQVAELIGGVRQVTVLKTAIGDLNSQYSGFRTILNATNNSIGAAETRNDSLNKSIASLANAASANFVKLSAAAGSLVFGPSIKKVLGGFNDASDIAGGEGIGQSIGSSILKGIGNALSGPGLVVGGFLAAKLLGSFSEFALKAAGNVLEIGKASEKQGQVQAGINELLKQSPGLYDSILTRARSITEQEELTLNAVRQRIEAERTLQAFTANVSAGFVNRGIGFSDTKFSGVEEAAPTVRKSGGYVPNIVDTVNRQAEISEAASNGYSVLPSQVREMSARINGKQSTVVYNSREKVIQNFANTGEPAIIPPGKTVMDLMTERFNKASGYVPNLRDYNKGEVEGLLSILAKTSGGKGPRITSANDQFAAIAKLSPEKRSAYIIEQLVDAKIPKSEIAQELQREDYQLRVFLLLCDQRKILI